MAKKMMAEVRFDRRLDGAEGYAIAIKDGDYWELESWYPLIPIDGGGQAEYVHRGILQQISYMQSIGYEVRVKA